MSTRLSQIADHARPSWPVHRQAVVRAKRALLASSTADRAEFNPGLAIADVLADLRHLCDRLGLDFARIDKQAHGHYISELQTKTKGAK